jgi:hypothetical protein
MSRSGSPSVASSTRLARRGDQFVGGRRHVEPGGELPEDPTVRLGQLHQDIHQLRLLSPG